ncbi:hypothetical protein KKI23_02630 [Patescibacteria group bacterium]|nr:hypothetical protein [Patescibacteria group bacterium]
MSKSEKSNIGWYFLFIVILIYLLIGFFRTEAIGLSLQDTWKIAKSIMPILVLVFVVMVITNYSITPDRTKKYLSKAGGKKRWLIALIGGVISMGPIYMWYPLLKDLKEDGASYGFIATFLYNRAVKLPLLPMMIFYFGWSFTIVLTVVMMIVSIIQGLIIEKMEGKII